MSKCDHKAGWVVPLFQEGVPRDGLIVTATNDGRVAFNCEMIGKPRYKVEMECNLDCGARRNVYISAKVERWGRITMKVESTPQQESKKS